MALVDLKSKKDFELDLYIKSLYHEVQSMTYSDDEGASKENKFTEYVMEKLAEAGETDGVRLCPYTKENKQENIQFKINGYALEEGYENIDIFITNYVDTNDLFRVTKADFEKMIKWSTGFVNAGLKGYLDEIEPSTEAYGLAKILCKNRNDIVRVRVFIISNGEIPHDTPKNFRLKKLEDICFIFEIWDIERLHRLEQSSGNREPIEIDFEDIASSTIPCLEMPVRNDLYECYLAIVPGTVLAALYQNYGTRLLESNVRAFLQQTGKINKGIRDTILKEPEMFLTYNNGLSTTAQEVKTKKTDGGQLEIVAVRDFQIVNGGQTTASLFHTARKYKNADLDKVFVQMKLTVIKDEETKTRIVPDISKYANSQNKVTELDLTSNNIFLQKLEEYSRTTYAIDPKDRSRQSIWFFERVSGQYKEALNKEGSKSKQNSFKLKYPKEQLLVKADVAKVLNIWYQKPYLVSKGAQKNYVSFIQEINKDGKKINRVYWEDIVANAILFRETDKLFGRKNINAIGDTNIKSHTIGYALSYFHFTTKNKLNLGEIWRTQCVDELLLIELKKLLVFVYEFFINLNVALISEAAKSEKVWHQLRDRKDNPMNMEVVSRYIISDQEYISRYVNVNEDSDDIVKYEELQKISNLGLKFWDGLCLFMLKQDLLTAYQQTFVSSIRKKMRENADLTENEISKGNQILEILTKHNINPEDVKYLSKIESVEVDNPEVIFNRIKSVDSDTWKQIIALGEQTGKLSENEISVVKSVIQKLRSKSNIDLRRMILTNEVLDKLKKYGLRI